MKTTTEKGSDLENHVAQQIVAKGIDTRAQRSRGSGNGNREKSDMWTNMQILGRQAGIECKHATVTCLPEWWRQTKKLESLGYEPILVIKQTHETFDGTKVVIYLDTFLDLVKAASGQTPVEIVAEDTRERRYAIERAIASMKALLKQYE